MTSFAGTEHGQATRRPPIVVLAAGSGTRMQAGATTPSAAPDKLAMTISGRPVLGWTLDFVGQHSHGYDVHVVLAAGSLLVPVAVVGGASTITAPNARRGMAWSLRDAADQVLAGRPGLVVLLGDDPLAALALGDVLDGARVQPDVPVCVERDGDVPHPVYLPASLLATFSPDAGGEAADRGLRDLLSTRDDVLRVPSEAPEPIDADTPADVAALGLRMRELGLV